MTLHLDDVTAADVTAAIVDNMTTEALIELASRLDDELEARTAEVITPVKEQLDAAKAELRLRALAAGRTLESSAGRVEFVKAGERVTWDDAGLLMIVARLAESQPDLCAQIVACRRATATEPTARVRFVPRRDA